MRHYSAPLPNKHESGPQPLKQCPLPPKQHLKPCSPVDPDKLEKIWGNHPKVSFLVQDLRYGFIIPHIPFLLVRTSCDHHSAWENQEIFADYIEMESMVGRIAGPFDEPPHPAFISSPLGVIPKKEPGALHVIHDLSYPKSFAVNDLIPNNLTYDKLLMRILTTWSTLTMREGQNFWQKWISSLTSAFSPFIPLACISLVSTLRANITWTNVCP